MRRARSLAAGLLGLACFAAIACKTAGTPKETGAAAAGPGAAAASQAAPRVVSPVQSRTVSYSAAARTAARTDRRATAAAPARNGAALARAATGAAGGLSRAKAGEIDPMRVLLYGGVPVFFVGVVGAFATGADARQRRAAPRRA